jgi:pimeloyl-ACP methyl ester carboxylesterase
VDHDAGGHETTAGQGPLQPQQPGFDARLLRSVSELRSFSRRTFLIGAGASTALAADMLITRRVQSQRRSTQILTVGDDFAEAYHPHASWILFPGYKTSWEEAQWILNSLRGALRQRGQLAAVGYSNLQLHIDQVTAAVVLHIRAHQLERLYFYGHSFGGMVATQVAARLRELHGVHVDLVLLDSTPFNRSDVLDQSWFEGVVFLYERGFRVPTVLRGGYELGERVVHKNERSWQQIVDQTLEQLSPIAPSSELIQSESAYIYHYDAKRFVEQLGPTRMAFIGNPRDETVNYQTARDKWARTFPRNMASTEHTTDGALPAHASPQWNPFVYRPIVEALQNELFPLPVGGGRALVY